MASTWDHPELGTFTYDGNAWVNKIHMPAFKAFSYVTPYSRGRSTGRHELAFQAWDEDETPSAGAVALAKRVLANQKELVAKVAEALWQDFNGEGPESGMWWHGQIDQIARAIHGDKPPTDAQALLGALRISRVKVFKQWDDQYDKPIVELSFHTPFDGGHGVSVLTDSEAILGIGYDGDLRLFKPAKKPRRGGGGREDANL